ncbi:MAG: hypothetical protein KJ572_10795, partial [Gammaproteobacteria bacterium]|nr:hypothetical protein [Gammaproteobacteria bacterium]
LDKMVGERGGYVAPYIDASAAEAAIRQAILDWQADRLTVTSLPPLNTKQAVDDILGSFARLRDGGYR